MQLYSYVVARDFGFAPNPFFGTCTLATCKPDIRRSAIVGDWIVGTGSKTRKRHGNLVYVMKVAEKMTFNQYWEDRRFQLKKPNLSGSPGPDLQRSTPYPIWKCEGISGPDPPQYAKIDPTSTLSAFVSRRMFFGLGEPSFRLW